MTRIISVTSGKDGVGKTIVTVHLAVQLAQRGQRVCLLDAGGGLADSGLLPRLKPHYTLSDLVLSGVELDKVMIRNCRGFDLVPCGSDTDWLDTLADNQLCAMATALSQLDDYDFILIDSPSTHAGSARAFTVAASETVLVITPEPGVLDDTYGLLRQLHEERDAGHIKLVVNKSKNHTVGRHTYDKFREVIEFYLGTDVPLLGLVNDDERVQQAMPEQCALVSHSPESAAAHDVGQLAGSLLMEQQGVPGITVQDFWIGFLRASGLSPADEHQMAPDSTVSDVAGDTELQLQLDRLSSRVGDLIAEVERLRAAGNRESAVISFPQDDRKATPSRCTEICFAVHTSSEDVTLQGETFSIYHMQRSNGDTQRFACHSLNDDIQEPEPQTTSS